MAAARSSSILRRALLYVPSSSARMLAKSLALTSDSISYDLEDSVTPAAKPAARDALYHHLTGLRRRPDNISELAVRINAVSTPWALDDLSALAALPSLDAIVIPKVDSASDLTFVTDALRHLAPARHGGPAPVRGEGQEQEQEQEPVRLIALIESARAIMDLRAICAASPYLSGLVFAAEDFALDLSITRTPSLTEFLYARSAIVTAARAARLPSAIDLVCTSFRGDGALNRLEEECQAGRAMGFNGKQCIHPSQLETVQRLFAPSEDDVERAVRILIADQKASSAGRGAWTLHGVMIDAPVVTKARATVGRAERCGIDVDSFRKQWVHQEPE